MNKNKKIILIVAGSGAVLLIATPVAIAAPLVLASFNSDEQTIKEAQAAIEKLTTAQKTVDLTKDVNRKLPSIISPTIVSIKALNVLIKGVIIVPNGVTYTPQVIDINDVKGEIVVKIEMQKGVVIETISFIVTRFTTIAQVQAKNQVAINIALAKVVKSAISGDGDKLPSLMDSTSIGTLKGFPQTTANGVYFSAAPKTSIDASGTLVITLRATKGSESQAKEFTINGFQTQVQFDQAAIAAVLARINDNTISGDNTKLPSAMTLASIAVLTSFPQSTTNELHFSATPKTPIDANGQLEITLRATKGSTSESKVITISGFKTQVQFDQATIAAVLARISDNTISGDNTKLPSTMTLASIVVLTSFPQPTANGVHFIATPKTPIDANGQLEITLRATKGSTSESKVITISGFKTQAQVDQDVVYAYKELIKNTITTTTKEPDKLSSKVQYTSIINFNAKTNAVLALPTRDVHVSLVSTNKDGWKAVTFTISKGTKSIEHTIIVTKFKTQARVEMDAAKAILDNLPDKTATTEIAQFATEVTYKDLTEFIAKTALASFNKDEQTALAKVTINVDAVREGDTFQLVTFSIQKRDETNILSTIIVTGFKSSKQAQADIDTIKSILNKLPNTKITDANYITQFALEVRYEDLVDFIAKTALASFNKDEQIAVAKVSIDIHIFWESDISQKVRFTISKRGGINAISTVIVTGFKSSVQVQADIDGARDILNNLVPLTTKTTKTATKVTYTDFADFISKTDFNSHIGVDQIVLNKVNINVLGIFIFRPFVNDNTSQKVSFKISKRGGKDSGSTIVVQGFKLPTI